MYQEKAEQVKQQSECLAGVLMHHGSGACGASASRMGKGGPSRGKGGKGWSLGKSGAEQKGPGLGPPEGWGLQGSKAGGGRLWGPEPEGGEWVGAWPGVPGRGGGALLSDSRSRRRGRVQRGGPLPERHLYQHRRLLRVRLSSRTPRRPRPRLLPR